MKKKIGILGGSFDPVHFGHLNLAVNMMEACQLDEVLFVPASVSPFKESAPPKASAQHRKQMLSLTIEPVGQFRLLDWELQSKGPSFTIDTVRKLCSDASSEFHLLLGDDQLENFARWKEAAELIRLAPPLIGTRERAHLAKAPIEFQEKLRKVQVKIPRFEISSTEIRKRLSEKKFCGHLIPATVIEYIEEHQLYSE
jgi:nicotinate-nucleotide adenylyltransferase